MLCIHFLQPKEYPHKWKKNSDYVHWNISFSQCIILKKNWKSCPFVVNAHFFSSYVSVCVCVYVDLMPNHLLISVLTSSTVILFHCIRFGSVVEYISFISTLMLHCAVVCGTHIFAHSHRVNTVVWYLFCTDTHTHALDFKFKLLVFITLQNSMQIMEVNPKTKPQKNILPSRCLFFFIF